MKLKFSDRCEQGTPSGVMVFRKGGEYDCTAAEAGFVVVSHEPRSVVRRVEGKRQPVVETQTRVSAAVLEKLLKFGPVKQEG